MACPFSGSQPVRFFLKPRGYFRRPSFLQDMRQRIIDAFELIRGEVFERGPHKFINWFEHCQDANDDHFKHFEMISFKFLFRMV